MMASLQPKVAPRGCCFGSTQLEATNVAVEVTRNVQRLPALEARPGADRPRPRRCPFGRPKDPWNLEDLT